MSEIRAGRKLTLNKDQAVQVTERVRKLADGRIVLDFNESATSRLLYLVGSAGDYQAISDQFAAAGVIPAGYVKKPADPAPVESPVGTTITPGQGAITDAQGRKVTVGTDGKVYRDGQPLGVTANVVKVIYADAGTLQSEAADGSKRAWNATTGAWEPVAGPAPDPTPDPTTLRFEPTSDGKSAKAKAGTVPAGADGIKWARASVATGGTDAEGFQITSTTGSFPGTAAKPYVGGIPTKGGQDLPGAPWVEPRLKTTQVAPQPDPTPDPTPDPGAVQWAIGMRIWEAEDRAAWNTIQPKAGTGVRYETGLNVADLMRWFNFYKGLGAAPIPLLSWSTGGWSDAAIDAFAATLPAEVKLVEGGNEHSYSYKGGNQSIATTNGRNMIRLQRALAKRGLGQKVLIEWEDGGQGGNAWFDGMIAGIGGQAALKEFGGGTCHPYGTNGVAKVKRSVAQSARFGHPDFALYLTEDGIACQNGVTLTDNYGWPRNLTETQAASTLKAHHDELLAIPQVHQITVYQSTDQKPYGATNEREHYFGITKAGGAPKGAITAYVQTRVR